MNRSLALCVILAAAAACRANDPVELELTRLVDDTSKILDKNNQKELRIGKFTGDGDVPSHFGPEIQRVLIAEFAKRKVGINKEALIEIKGDYGPATEDVNVPSSKLLFIRLNATLVNTKTRLALANLPSRAIYGNEAIVRAFAPNVSLPPDAGLEARNEALKPALKNPQTARAGSKIKTSDASPFAVEVLVVNNAQAPDPADGVPARIKDGLALVDVKRDQYYRVKIHNDAPFDVAVRLTIDGLDQFVFSDAEFRDQQNRPRFQYVIVKKGTAKVIRGWFRSLKQADSFVVTEYARSAAKELNAAQGEIGQICVGFHAAWERDEDKPADESGKDAATGRGEKVDVNLRPIHATVGALRDVVSIRYTK
jgi:hypothetical protein